MSALTRRRGVGAVRRATGGFNPVTLATWAHAYWTGGTEFTALGLADGGAVTSWPDEIGSADMALVSGTPLFRAAASVLNNKPAIEAFGSGLMDAAITSIPQPWTIAAIYHSSGGDTSGALFGAQANGSSNRGLTKAQLGAGALLGLGGAQNGAVCLVAEGNGASSKVWRNGTLIASGDAGTAALVFSRVFSRQNAGAVNPLTGHLAFAAAKAGTLTAGQLSDLNTGAAAFYGTT